MKAVIKRTLAIFIVCISLLCSACTFNLGELQGEGTTKIINGINENKVLTSNVTILAYTITGRKISQGSGVIYKENEGTYYALTNNHVIYEGFMFEIMDAYGDIWNAQIAGHDEKYDLAVVKFKINNEKEFYIPKIVSIDPKVNANVISLGNPQGVMNAVSFGTVGEYVSIEAFDNDTMMDDAGSNVKFEVIKHDAPIDSGSSGGAILDYDYNICGINFASGRGENGEFVSGYAIQPTKILEFLTDKGLN